MIILSDSAGERYVRTVAIDDLKAWTDLGWSEMRRDSTLVLIEWHGIEWRGGGRPPPPPEPQKKRTTAHVEHWTDLEREDDAT